MEEQVNDQEVAVEDRAIRRSFTFEMYAPTSYSPSGVPIVDRINVQMQGENLTRNDVVTKFIEFLLACGYGD
jgi:hypothetical protein